MKQWIRPGLSVTIVKSTKFQSGFPLLQEGTEYSPLPRTMEKDLPGEGEGFLIQSLDILSKEDCNYASNTILKIKIA